MSEEPIYHAMAVALGSLISALHAASSVGVRRWSVLYAVVCGFGVGLYLPPAATHFWPAIAELQNPMAFISAASGQAIIGWVRKSVPTIFERLSRGSRDERPADGD